jgi:D-proline reductase (dithiol) PrdB
VGLLAREIEARGVSTVALALVKELAVLVKAPRMLYLHWPFGHALGEPDNREQQRTILHNAFSLARAAPRPGLLVELPYRWKREVYPPIADWTADSQVFAAALRASASAARTGTGAGQSGLRRTHLCRRERDLN